MKEGNGANPLTLLCIVLSVAALAVAGYAVIDDGPDDGYDQVRYILYFGMGDRTDEEIQPIEDFIISQMQDNSYGYNMEWESGGYTDGGVHMKDRVSLKFVTSDRDPDVILQIIENTKERFGIEAVFLEKHLVDSSFV